MEPDDKIPTITYYRMEPVDTMTARLVSIELTGRRVGKKTVIVESTPSIVRAHWARLAIGKMV